MSFLLVLLCIFLLIYYAPRILLWIAQNRIRKQAQQYSEAFRQAAGMNNGGGQRPAAERKGGWTAPIPRRKKIDPQTGEYIRFQEIDTTNICTEESPDGRGNTESSVEAEQQVVDIQWTDLPPADK